MVYNGEYKGVFLTMKEGSLEISYEKLDDWDTFTLTVRGGFPARVKNPSILYNSKI